MSDATPPTDLTPAIVTNVSSPNAVTADGVTVTNNRIPEQIAGDKYLNQKATRALPNGGVMFIGLRAGGTQ